MLILTPGLSSRTIPYHTANTVALSWGREKQHQVKAGSGEVARLMITHTNIMIAGSLRTVEDHHE